MVFGKVAKLASGCAPLQCVEFVLGSGSREKKELDARHGPTPHSEAGAGDRLTVVTLQSQSKEQGSGREMCGPESLRGGCGEKSSSGKEEVTSCLAVGPRPIEPMVLIIYRGLSKQRSSQIDLPCPSGIF